MKSGCLQQVSVMSLRSETLLFAVHTEQYIFQHFWYPWCFMDISFVPGECCKCLTSALHAWHSLQDYLSEDWSWDLVPRPRAATAATHRHPPGCLDISAVGDHLKSPCQPSWVPGSWAGQWCLMKSQHRTDNLSMM